MTWFVYILRCSDGSLYTGVTTDLQRRLREHNSGVGSACTRARRPVKPLYQEARQNRASALRREAEIKRLPREEKEQLCSGEMSCRRNMIR